MRISDLSSDVCFSDLPIARQRQLDELDVLRELLADTEPDEIESGDTLHYRVPGVQDAVMRRLRRGHYRIDGEQIGRAHVRTPVPNAHPVCRPLLEKKKRTALQKLNKP